MNSSHSLLASTHDEYYESIFVLLLSMNLVILPLQKGTFNDFLFHIFVTNLFYQVQNKILKKEWQSSSLLEKRMEIYRYVTKYIDISTMDTIGIRIFISMSYEFIPCCDLCS